MEPPKTPERAEAPASMGSYSQSKMSECESVMSMDSPEKQYSKSQPTTPHRAHHYGMHRNASLEANGKTSHLPIPTTPTSHHYYQRRSMRYPTTPGGTERRLASPHCTPPRPREYQDRYMPARTPRSARIKLDFSDSDQGPLARSPFVKSSPTKTPKSSSGRAASSSDNRQQNSSSNSNNTNNDLSYVASRLFRSPRRNLYQASSPTQVALQSATANAHNRPHTHTSTNVNDALQIGQNREQVTYQSIIANELLDAGIQHIPDSVVENNFGGNQHHFAASNNASAETSNSNFVVKNDSEMDDNMRIFTSPNARRSLFEYSNVQMPSAKSGMDCTSPYSQSPLSNASQKLLASPRRPQRKIPKMPFKVLDAPELADDFYLNLVDWGLNNSLAVGLGNSVYLWNAANSNVTKLCDYSNENDQITSVSWCDSGIAPVIGATRQHFFNNWYSEGDSADSSGGGSHTRSTRSRRTTRYRAGRTTSESPSEANLPSSTSSSNTNLSGAVPAPVFSAAELNHSSSAAAVATPGSGEGRNNSDPATDETTVSDIGHIDPDATILANHGSEIFDRATSPDVQYPDLHNEFNNTNHQHLIGVGTSKGQVQIWDVERQKAIHSVRLHEQRVGALAWNNHLITSGSRDRFIAQFDIRVGKKSMRKFAGHRQEVCGLRWSPDRTYLASGGNDNKLLVWSVQNQDKPQQTYADHIAAVKAIAWSPHQHGLLASGGGTADRCIKFWNTHTQQPQSSIDTGSQVCNLAWSRHNNEVVSTHGYSQNQIIVWRYPSMTPIAKLIGHTFRVLFLAMSPDGEAVVTGAGDETLRFWNVFSKSRSSKEADRLLNFNNRIR